jgi:hypothetical protein
VMPSHLPFAAMALPMGWQEPIRRPPASSVKLRQQCVRTLVPMTVAPVGSKTQTLAGKPSLSRRLCAGLLAGRRVDRVVWNQLFIGRVQKGGKDV